MFTLLLLSCGLSEPPDVRLNEPPDVLLAKVTPASKVITITRVNESLWRACYGDTCHEFRGSDWTEEKIRTLLAAPEVAVPATFPKASKPVSSNVGYHAGHNCPTCGRQQLVIDSGSKYGPHAHRCPFDGTVWTH